MTTETEHRMKAHRRLSWALAVGLLAVATPAAAGAQDAAPPSEPASSEAVSPLAQIDAAARAGMEAAGFERLETEAAGRRLVVWRGGSGPDLVLLHGTGRRGVAWVTVAPALAHSYTVHALDLPGHGESEPVDGPLAFATIVGGLESYLLGLDREAILVGNSMGAWLATLMAHRHPDRVARAVLVNGGALFNPPAEGLTLMPANREEARRVMAAIRDPQSPPIPDALLDDIVIRAHEGPIGRLMTDTAGLVGHLLDGRLGEVSVPIDLLWGTSDRLMPLAYARRMEAALPRVRLTELERCGHIPSSECPDRFLAALLEILAAPPPPARQAPAPEPASEPAEAVPSGGSRR